MSARDFLDESSRRADVEYVYLPEEWSRVRVGKSNFWCDESAGVVGAESGIRRLARIAIEAAGKIDREAVGGREVHLPDCSIKWWPRRAT